MLAFTFLLIPGSLGKYNDYELRKTEPQALELIPVKSRFYRSNSTSIIDLNAERRSHGADVWGREHWMQSERELVMDWMQPV